MKIQIGPKVKISLLLLFISIATIISYANTLSNGLVWDDIDFIRDWQLTRSPDNSLRLIAGDLPTGQEGVYRPVRSIFYMVCYRLYGISPFGYHAQALLFHLACTILIFFITDGLTRKISIATITSLLFGIHPIHTEAVSFISASFDMIGIFFLLGSFLCYLLASQVTGEGARIKKEKTGKQHSSALYLISVLFALVAFFTYEMTLILPLLIVLSDIFLRKPCRKRILIYLPYFAGVAVYLVVRMMMLGITSRGEYLNGSIAFTMPVMLLALGRYLFLSILPYHLSINHTLAPGILSFRMDTVALGLARLPLTNILIATAIFMVIIGILFTARKRHPLAWFCMAWFFISLLPVSNIIPQAAIFGEKYAYLASFGICLLAGYAIERVHSIYTSQNVRRMIVMVVLIFCAASMSQTILRNQDWSTEVEVWKTSAEDSPTSVTAHNRLGLAYLELKRVSEAKEAFRTAITLDPGYVKGYNNLGIALAMEGDLEGSESAYMKAIDLNPDYINAYYNLALVYKKKGDDEKAKATYETAARIGKKYSE